MNIAIIGGGYVGLVSAACFAQFGVHVTVAETDPARLTRLQARDIPIYEPGLEALVAANRAASRLTETAIAAIEDAAILVVMTEWNEFRALAPGAPRGRDAGPPDRRSPQHIRPRGDARAGFVYHGVGRGGRPRAATAFERHEELDHG